MTQAEIRKIRDSAQWRNRTRPLQLRAFPYCQECDTKGELTEASQVDHIIPLEQGGAPFDSDNLQSLCFRCHVIKTAGENRKKRKLIIG